GGEDEEARGGDLGGVRGVNSRSNYLIFRHLVSMQFILKNTVLPYSEYYSFSVLFDYICGSMKFVNHRLIL
ncbi:MAG TPA: hypothetical protein PLM24_03990, partial [Methanothrix sp.]|nr:hypothetical protein [Methanothrix sp.]